MNISSSNLSVSSTTATVTTTTRSTRTLRHRTSIAVGALALSAALGLSACSAPGGSGTTQTAASDPATHSSTVTLDHTWAKAGTDGMTSAFGLLENTGDQLVTLLSAESAAAESVELHEMAMVNGAMVMRKIEGNFEIPVGGTRELSPGGEHLMLMGLTAPLLPGDELTMTLRFSDGSTQNIVFPVRDTGGADEEYAPGEHGMGDSHMEHGSQTGDSTAEHSS